MEIKFIQVKSTIFAIVNGFLVHLPNFVVGFLLLVMFVFAANSVKRLIERICSSREFPDSVGIIMGRMSQWSVWAGGLLVCLSVIVPSFNAKDLIQLLGVSGVAIGFAFKEVFQNFLAGVIILVSAPFRIGDLIKFGDFEGIVEDIETRATRIRLTDGRVAIVPNAKLFTDPVVVDRRSPAEKKVGNSAPL